MADELRANQCRARPTRWILPVGPVKQYFRLVEISNRERLSWRNADIFQMDEFLDWQGRPIPVDHPLSFEGFMRREVFERLDAEFGRMRRACTFPIRFVRMRWRRRWTRPAGSIRATEGSVSWPRAFNDPPISRWFRVGGRDAAIDDARGGAGRRFYCGAEHRLRGRVVGPDSSDGGDHRDARDSGGAEAAAFSGGRRTASRDLPHHAAGRAFGVLSFDFAAGASGLHRAYGRGHRAAHRCELF